MPAKLKSLIYFGTLGINLSFLSQAAEPLPLEVDVVAGVSIPSNSSFEDAPTVGVSTSYVHNSLRYRAGYLKLGDFELNNDSENRLEISGPHIAIIKGFDTGFIAVEIGAGIIFTETDIYLENIPIQNTNDTSPFLELNFLKSLEHSLDLQFGVSWFSDISGTDITLPKAGLRYKF